MKYVPGHEAASQIMARRSLERDASFLIPFLERGMKVLDCGCGPGTITIGISKYVGDDGFVCGVDCSDVEIKRAKSLQKVGASHTEFVVEDLKALSFETSSFDLVLFHAALSHVADANLALAEAFRVLKPGGVLAAREPDMRGYLFHPEGGIMEQLFSVYHTRRLNASGDPWIGGKLNSMLMNSGFVDVDAGGEYESIVGEENLTIEFVPFVEEFGKLNGFGGRFQDPKASALSWASDPGSFFARSWVRVIGRKPDE